MTFRPTTIERAYQLAESGTYQTVNEVKAQLQAEGFTRLQDHLYGSTITKALRDRCAASFKPEA